MYLGVPEIVWENFAKVLKDQNPDLAEQIYCDMNLFSMPFVWDAECTEMNNDFTFTMQFNSTAKFVIPVTAIQW